MYKRFDRTIQLKENLSDVVVHLKDHTKSLDDHLKLLEKVKKIF